MIFKTKFILLNILLTVLWVIELIIHARALKSGFIFAPVSYSVTS